MSILDVIRSLLKHGVGGLVLPAQEMFRKTPDPKLALWGHQNKTLELQEEYIPAKGGANLKTLTVLNKNEAKKDIAEQRYVINFNPNAGRYQDNFNQMTRGANNLFTHVVGFNYRNTAGSTWKPSDPTANVIQKDLVNDGIAQVQHLLDKGVKAKNITLNGHSLGGAVATLVAAHFHAKEEKVYLFNDRSFSNLTNTAVGWVRTLGSSGHKETTLGKILGWFAEPIVKLALSVSKWEMEVAEAYVTIPKEYREHTLIRSSKEDRKNHPEIVDDSTIPHSASLHNAPQLKTERRQEKEKLKNYPEKLEAFKEHNRARKMVTSRYDNQDGHTDDLDQLLDRTGNSPTFFNQFIEKSPSSNPKDLSNQNDDDPHGAPPSRSNATSALSKFLPRN